MYLRISSSRCCSFFLPSAMLRTKESFCSSSSGRSLRTTLPSNCASRPKHTHNFGNCNLRHAHDITDITAGLSAVTQSQGKSKCCHCHKIITQKLKFYRHISLLDKKQPIKADTNPTAMIGGKICFTQFSHYKKKCTSKCAISMYHVHSYQRIVTLAICALYKYSYLLTYLLTYIPATTNY